MTRASSHETRVAGQDVYSGYVSDGTNGTPRISSETRPVNLSINFIIKY
ncbi:hypothetical protein OAQ99_03850 [Candidatus Kapabacteria bacterium]|nr:hypothetical protein [Candidatus Kapabacteria bacterium]